jgi:hypothetical protein
MTERRERNRQTVMAFYDLMFNGCKPAEAIDASGLKLAGLAVDVTELSVAIWMRRAFAGLGQRLQAVVELVQ